MLKMVQHLFESESGKKIQMNRKSVFFVYTSMSFLSVLGLLFPAAMKGQLVPVHHVPQQTASISVSWLLTRGRLQLSAVAGHIIAPVFINLQLLFPATLPPNYAAKHSRGLKAE